jgi:ABC-2 type transport system permease protein
MNAIADLSSIYTWQTWTFGWLARMLSQVLFFVLAGQLLGPTTDPRFLLVGNALMPCVIEAMMVVASTTWERRSGTLPLLTAAPASIGLVFFGRSLQWLVSGVATSVVALLGVGPFFGVTASPARIPLVIMGICLTAVTSYCFGLFLAALVLSFMTARNVVSNLAYLLMMAVCGVEVPLDFWPPAVTALAHAFPLTYGLQAVRGLLDGGPIGTTLAWSALEAGVGACWLVAAMLAFRVLVARGRTSGSIEFST